MSVLAQREVLVLNKGWTAVGIVSLERAIVMLFSAYKDGTPKAKIIDPQDFQQFTWADWSVMKPKDGEERLAATSQDFRIPEVILLTRYEKMPQQKANFSRRTLFRRDNFQCQYCGGKPGSSELTLDHIQPKSRGGKTTWENIVCACVTCNARKADRTPDEAGMKSRSPMSTEPTGAPRPLLRQMLMLWNAAPIAPPADESKPEAPQGRGRRGGIS
jgi:5-methylcytosine-specific restriction endonuclease McrA